MLTAFINNCDAEVLPTGIHRKFCFGYGYAAFTVDNARVSDSVCAYDSVCLGAGDVNLAVLVPEVVDLGALGGVEITVLECFCDGAVVKAICLDRRPRISYVIVARIWVSSVVVVITTDAVDLLSVCKKIIVNTLKAKKRSRRCYRC